MKRAAADTGAVTLIQRFGSAANSNIPLHCLVLDGVYRCTEGEPVFEEARAPTGDALQGLLDKIIARLLKRLTRLGYLVQEQGMTYLADIDPDHPLTPLQAASCTYRIALGPRAGQKVLRLRSLPDRDEQATAGLCTDAHGFSLHAGVRCGEHQRKRLERLCRPITRPTNRERTAQSQWQRPSPAPTQEPLARRHHAQRDEPAVIVRILRHLGLPARAPPRSPARPTALFQAA